MLTQKTHNLSRHKGYNKQGGIAFLVLVIAIFLAISTYYLTSVSLVELQVDKVEKTQAVLKRAKHALLGFARVNWRLAGEGGKIGKLPCPDYNASGVDGEQDGNCGNAYANTIGYFPWRTLGIEITKDSSGNCLLYAVSPAYKTSPAAALNPDSFGQFRIVDNTGAVTQGVSPEDRPVAVIIAAESTLPGQARREETESPIPVCGSYYDDVPNLVAAYLDNDGTTNNAAIDPGTDNVIEKFVAEYAGSAEADNPLNDRLVTISYREFWDAMESSITDTAFTTRMEDLTEAIAVCLAAYGNTNSRYLPMPATLNLDGGEYRRDVAYLDSGNFTEGYSGRLPYKVEQANTKIGNSDNNILFKNNYCDDINLPSTAAVVEHIWFTDPDDNPVVDGLEGEYFDLWRNWKDHFFYAISKSHNPAASTPASDCSGDCIEVNGTKYAGIVFFSGLKNGQQRYTGPFDGALASKVVDADNVDDKDGVINYLENTNADDFPVYSGSPLAVVQPANDGLRVFSPVAGSSNDIMFCIRPDMTVSQCL